MTAEEYRVAAARLRMARDVALFHVHQAETDHSVAQRDLAQGLLDDHLALMKANNIPMITEPDPWAPPEPKAPKRTDAAPSISKGFWHRKKSGRGRSGGKAK